MPSGDAGDAFALACRLTDALDDVEFGPAGKITISVGISQGPERDEPAHWLPARRSR
jgi:hypothetical protein